LYDSQIYSLSDVQLRVADILAIYNPKLDQQTFNYEGSTYTIPPKSYRLIKLH